MGKRGFALIELIVVISVVTALTTIAIANFPKIKLQLAVLRAANIFAENMRKTQQMALSSLVYRDSSSLEQEVDGYGLHVDLNELGNKKYIIYADKSPGNKEYDETDYIVETIDFSSTEPGIKIKEINNVSLEKASVNFSSLKIETTITQLLSGQNSAEFVFSVESDEESTKSVFVNTSGLIEAQ